MNVLDKECQKISLAFLFQYIQKSSSNRITSSFSKDECQRYCLSDTLLLTNIHSMIVLDRECPRVSLAFLFSKFKI